VIISCPFHYCSFKNELEIPQHYNPTIPHIWKYSQKLCTIALLTVHCVSKARNRHSKGHRNNELKTWYFVKYQSVWYFFAEHDVFVSCSWAGICNYFCYMWYHRFKCRQWQCYNSYMFLYCFCIFCGELAYRICEH
jgi:hypothetical protein